MPARVSRTIVMTLLLGFGSPLVASPALAVSKAQERKAAEQAAAQAELVRLQGQLRSLASRGHWTGVDEIYQRMAELEHVKPDLEDHLRGIEAAEALGRPDLAWPRVNAALTLSDSADLIERHARLGIFYGEIELTVAKDVSPAGLTLSMVDMPLDPAQRRVVETAQTSLRATGSYAGLLPLGQYAVGGSTFDIVGGPSESVVIQPSRDD